MCFHISYLNKEELHTMVFAIGDESGSYNGVSGCHTQVSRPEFDGIIIWSVEDNLLGFGVKSGSSLESLDIGSMAKFGLSISTEDLKISGHLDPLTTMFIGSK